MANLQSVKVISRDKKISLRSIADQLSITEQGLHKMIREETMSAVVLEKVAKILNVNVCVFFDRDTLCDQFEQYVSTGSHAIQAKEIRKIDNRSTTHSDSLVRGIL